MREALARHDDVLRTIIEAHGGWLFKHTGDGVLAAFSSPRAAVDAAIDTQRGLEWSVRAWDAMAATLGVTPQPDKTIEHSVSML